MPEYVKEKSYYRDKLFQPISEDDESDKSTQKWVDFIVLPSVVYDYVHFEGKGFSKSPFKSAWFCRVRGCDWESINSGYANFDGVNILLGGEGRKRRKGPKKRKRGGGGEGGYGRNVRVNNEKGRRDAEVRIEEEWKGRRLLRG